MNVLPGYKEAIIPIEKFTRYALDYSKDPDKAAAFEMALGYTQSSVDSLIANIMCNLANFPATPKGDKGYGMTYEVIMDLLGPNGKSARVLTAWIADKNSSQMRLITAHID